MHYNIYVGQDCFQGADLKKLEKLAAWLKVQDADVVGLCECNGWQDWSVDVIKEALGYPHAAFENASKPKNAHVMVLSKTPMEVIEHPEVRAVYYHAFLHVKTAGVHVMETHLNPYHAKGRLVEINAFLPIIDAIKDEPVILMGDMNSIMPSSKGKNYDEKELLTLMRNTREGKLVSRHCIDGHELEGYGDKTGTRQLSDDWQFDYRPLELVGSHLHELVPVEEMATYPTSFREDQKDDPSLRIDGVFVNEPFGKKYPSATLNIIHNDEVENLSDHYPCYITM